MVKKLVPPCVVIDTNVLISCLLFGGRLNRLRDLWLTHRIIPLLSKKTFDEFKRVLSYPKFALSPQEIQGIIQLEILPYFDVVATIESIRATCRDQHDDAFIELAICGKAAWLITGDKDLLVLKQFHSTTIITPSDFLQLEKFL
jgi:putative PIN family toxin of toxin-antitoxin system